LTHRESCAVGKKGKRSRFGWGLTKYRLGEPESSGGLQQGVAEGPFMKERQVSPGEESTSCSVSSKGRRSGKKRGRSRKPGGGEGGKKI